MIYTVFPVCVVAVEIMKNKQHMTGISWHFIPIAASNYFI